MGPDYWSRTASERRCSHPLPPPGSGWLDAVDRGAPVLDLGCGYGRTVAELVELGFERAVGLDPAEGMIARGRREHPSLDLRLHPAGEPLPFDGGDEGTFALVLLLAVLTSVPDDAAQDALLAEARRVLAPGGLLFVSDLPLQTGERARERYAAGLLEHGVYGTFTLPDGGVSRHHDEARLAAFGTDLEPLRRRELDGLTMNGNPCRIVQLAWRKPG